MRVTNKMMNDNAVRYMNENQERLFALQEKTASQKQFQRASDNPSGAIASLELRSHMDANQAYMNTIDGMESWYSAADFSIQQMVKVAARAVTLTQQGISDTLGEDERGALAAELGTILEEAVGIGNTTHQGKFLFSGLKTDAIPFSLADADADGQMDTVTYHGDANVILRSIGPGQSMAQNIRGDAAFSPLFEAIIAARKALTGSDKPSIEAAIRGLHDAISTVNEAMTTNGARHRQVKYVGERLEKTHIELKSLLSQKEDVNLAEAISHYRYQETVYQAVLEVSQRTISALNLFDFLG